MNQTEAQKLKDFIDTLVDTPVNINKTMNLIDERGRFVPKAGSNVIHPNTDFYLTQPKIDYQNRLKRLKGAFKGQKWPTVKEFQRQSESLIKQVSESAYANLLKGVYLPIILPKIKFEDYGAVIEDIFLPAVEKSYKQQFPDRKFYNYRKGTLKNEVTVVSETHQQLIDRMAEKLVVALFFVPFQGFSIPATREITLMENYSLGGVIDIAMAFIMYPDILARDWNTPVLDCSAVSWQDPDYSLCFYVNDGGFRFDRRDLRASGVYSGGLSFFR